MSLSAIEILEIMRHAKGLGLRSIEVDGVKAEFHEDKATKVHTDVPEMSPEDIMKPLSPFDDLTEEEILYWATPYFDELQAKKEAHKQKLTEEFKERANG